MPDATAVQQLAAVIEEHMYEAANAGGEAGPESIAEAILRQADDTRSRAAQRVAAWPEWMRVIASAPHEEDSPDA